MSKELLKSGAAGFALVASLFVVSPATAQLGGVTGQVGGAVDATARTATDLQSKTRLEKEADLRKAEAAADLENQTDVSNQTEVGADAMGDAQSEIGENAVTDAAAETAVDDATQTDLSQTTQAGAAIDGSAVKDETLNTMTEGQTRVTEGQATVETAGDVLVDTATKTSGRTAASIEAQNDAMSETIVDTGETVQSQADVDETVSGEAEAGTTIGVNAPSNIGVDVSSPVSVGVQSNSSDARYSNRSELGAEASAPSTSLDGMLTIGTAVMSTSGATLGTISGLETTEAGVISAVNLEGQANAVPVSALSAEGGVLVSSMTEADVK